MMAILNSTGVVMYHCHRILSLHVITMVLTSLVSSIFVLRVNEIGHVDRNEDFFSLYQPLALNPTK